MKDKLKSFYNLVYKNVEDRHYSKNLFGRGVPLQVAEVLSELSLKNKTVLEVGCGTGFFAFLAKKAGAKKVVGVDYSNEAIRLAKKNHSLSGLEFYCRDFQKIRGKFDVIVSLGVIEHIDSPIKALRQLKNLLAKNGHLIIVCPNWSNPRGYVLLTLHYLFKSKITLADKHYLTPVEFQNWAEQLKMRLTFRTFDHDWAFGKKMIKDFQRRLPRVLPGNRNVKKLIKWLTNHTQKTEKSSTYNGAIALYHFR